MKIFPIALKIAKVGAKFCKILDLDRQKVAKVAKYRKIWSHWFLRYSNSRETAEL